MKDTQGKNISGYQYGMYWFGVLRSRIQGLCSVSYNSEKELLEDYDKVYGDHEGSPVLDRMYEDGSSVRLRPRWS